MSLCIIPQIKPLVKFKEKRYDGLDFLPNRHISSVNFHISAILTALLPLSGRYTTLKRLYMYVRKKGNKKVKDDLTKSNRPLYSNLSPLQSKDFIALAISSDIVGFIPSETDLIAKPTP